MCQKHDLLHYDWRVRAVAGTMAGMDRCPEDLLERGRATRDLLMRHATVMGLLDSLESTLKDLPEHVRMRCRVRLLCLGQEIQSEALAALSGEAQDPDDVPF